MINEITPITQPITSNLNCIFNKCILKNGIKVYSTVYNNIIITKITTITYYNTKLVKELLKYTTCIFNLRSKYVENFTRIYAQKSCNSCNSCNFSILLSVLACNFDVVQLQGCGFC